MRWNSRWLARACTTLLLALAPAWAAGSSAEQRALQLFKQSESSYRAGRFSEAAKLLREAYALQRSPTLLYNLARALESDGDDPGALDAYQRYLAEEKAVPDRRAIEQRIANLERAIRERGRAESEKAAAEAARLEAERKLQTSAEVTKPPAPTPEGPRSPSAKAWVFAGLGVVSFGVGATLGGLALSRNGAAAAAPSMREADAGRAAAQTLALSANVTYIIATVLVLAGLGWGLFDVLA